MAKLFERNTIRQILPDNTAALQNDAYTRLTSKYVRNPERSFQKNKQYKKSIKCDFLRLIVITAIKYHFT